jgi:hypothetical protein
MRARDPEKVRLVVVDIKSREPILTKQRTGIGDLMDLCNIDQTYPRSNGGSLFSHYLV